MGEHYSPISYSKINTACLSELIKGLEGGADRDKELPPLFFPSEEPGIGEPLGREEDFSRMPARTPEAHPFFIVSDDEGGDVEVGGQVAQK